MLPSFVDMLYVGCKDCSKLSVTYIACCTLNSEGVKLICMSSIDTCWPCDRVGSRRNPGFASCCMCNNAWVCMDCCCKVITIDSKNLLLHGQFSEIVYKISIIVQIFCHWNNLFPTLISQPLTEFKASKLTMQQSIFECIAIALYATVDADSRITTHATASKTQNSPAKHWCWHQSTLQLHMLMGTWR